jgi:hypothetical protein
VVDTGHHEVSPRRKNASRVSSSVWPVRLVPETFSARITVHPTAARVALLDGEATWSVLADAGVAVGHRSHGGAVSFGS